MSTFLLTLALFKKQIRAIRPYHSLTKIYFRK